ncbi:MAG TPA: hypothetical protein VHR40_10245 [Thermoleophilaceae bacterium]|nr:hypothetical protein [Thermoleophilaceae bacterium]
MSAPGGHAQQQLADGARRLQERASAVHCQPEIGRRQSHQDAARTGEHHKPHPHRG